MRNSCLCARSLCLKMIQLNPLVIDHYPCRPHQNAPPDEFHAVWYKLIDRVSYIPGIPSISSKVPYKACFHDLPRGLQTHVYAPAGLDIKEKWSIGGNEPGEPREVLELGLHDVPREGLYLREDVDMQCNYFLTSFVTKNLKRAHSVLVDRLVVKADIIEDRRVRSNYGSISSQAANTIAEMPGSEVFPAPMPQPLAHQQSWDTCSQTKSPTVASSSRSASLRSDATGSERRYPSSRSVLVNKPEAYKYKTYNPYEFETARSSQSDLPSGAPTQQQQQQPPQYQPYNPTPRSDSTSTASELPAGDAATPAYPNQQRYQEQQILGYFEKPQQDWARRDSSVYTERLRTAGPQPGEPRDWQRKTST